MGYTLRKEMKIKIDKETTASSNPDTVLAIEVEGKRYYSEFYVRLMRDERDLILKGFKSLLDGLTWEAELETDGVAAKEVLESDLIKKVTALMEKKS